MARLIVGCGYLGRRVGARWLAAGEVVYAVTRSAQRAAALEEHGYRPLIADVTRPETFAAWPSDVDTMLYAVGYDRSAGSPMREVYVDGLANVLEAVGGHVRRLLYVSSTGVYGEGEGDWVTEETPCRPTRPGGIVCREAEGRLARHALAARAVVLRMAGLYGPGRVPYVEALRAGRAIAAPAEGYLNLIHIDDAASVVLAADERAPLARTYLVSDGHPVIRSDYYGELARLLRTGPPQFTEPDPASPAAERAAGSKRIRNTRMLEELSIVLRYPSYREGLRAVVEGDLLG